MSNEVNIEKICPAVLGITSRRYRQLAADSIVPPVEKGLVDFPLACKQYIDYLRKLAEGQGSLSLTDERVRLTKANADIKEQQFKKESGMLIETETAMKLWGEVLQRIRLKLLYIPTKLSPLIIGLDSQSKIKTKTEILIREVLTELAEIDFTKQRRGSNDGGSVSAQASTKIKRKRVGRPKKTVKP